MGKKVSKPLPSKHFNLFNTGATQDLFAVQRNLHTQGPWMVNIPVAVGPQPIELSEISLDAFIFTGGGLPQNFSRDFDLTIDLLDSTQTNILATDSVVDEFPNNDVTPNPSPVPFLFDFTGNTLQANTTFFLRLTASGQGSNGIFGTNSGIDNLVVTGTVVPEPLTILGASTAAGFGAFFKRQINKKKKEK